MVQDIGEGIYRKSISRSEKERRVGKNLQRCSALFLVNYIVSILLLNAPNAIKFGNFHN